MQQERQHCPICRTSWEAHDEWLKPGRWVDVMLESACCSWMSDDNSHAQQARAHLVCPGQHPQIEVLQSPLRVLAVPAFTNMRALK
jgi:hypothetical protein